MARAASGMSRKMSSLIARLTGLITTAIRVALGTNSCRSASRFAVNSVAKKLIPVRFPPGIAGTPAIHAALAHRPIGIILVLRLLDADRQKNFQRGIGLGSHRRRKGAGVEARFLKGGIHASARSVGPGFTKTPKRPARRRRSSLTLRMRRQPLPALLAPLFVRLIDPP